MKRDPQVRQSVIIRLKSLIAHGENVLRGTYEFVSGDVKLTVEETDEKTVKVCYQCADTEWEWQMEKQEIQHEFAEKGGVAL